MLSFSWSSDTVSVLLYSEARPGEGRITPYFDGPGGLATHETFEWLRGELVDAVRAALPVDAVLLALHGALVADGAPDVEGEVLEAVRRVLGPRVPPKLWGTTNSFGFTSFSSTTPSTGDRITHQSRNVLAKA